MDSPFINCRGYSGINVAQVFDSSLSVPDTLEFPLLIKPVSEMYIHVTHLIKSSEAQLFPEEKLPLILH
ncbi:hypothetical protein AV530_014768 [Patagioenas fasciata monilis]|uniref:Uncharacterized protein n=1 Tax=Patagioenas fasciata monilis TaxID=372326 RepID=A0A1V4L079_PATFA|nr:hypothetical protein AV530_014768 [Patagioenas fasciata monilis]